MANNTDRKLGRHLKHTGIEPDEPLSIHTLRKSCIQNRAQQRPESKRHAKACRSCGFENCDAVLLESNRERKLPLLSTTF
jgi:hypothetical protein